MFLDRSWPIRGGAADIYTTLSNPEPLKFLKGCNVVISENGCNSMGYDYFPYASDSYLLSWDCQIKL